MSLRVWAFTTLKVFGLGLRQEKANLEGFSVALEAEQNLHVFLMECLQG